LSVSRVVRQIGRVTLDAWIVDEFGFHGLEHASCAVATGWHSAMLETQHGALACKACGYRADSPLSGSLADCFDLRHRQWGLRGDPHLWELLRERLSGLATPPDVLGALQEAFAGATGVDLRSDESEQVHLDELDHGGMSGGTVSLDWWRRKAIPLMTRRATRR
jgi:hypothetical protein